MNKIKAIVEKIRHSYYDIMKVLAFVIAVVIVVLLMPRNVKFKYEYQKMRPWPHESLYAPFNFPIYKSEETVRKEKEEALTTENIKININTAGEEELTALNGIGPAKAKKIIEFRNKNGGFKSIEELMLVPGIKEGTFSKIKEDISV